MRKQGKYLTFSLVVHLVGILVFGPFLNRKINIEQNRNSDSDTYRRESIRLAIAVNSMKKIEETLTERASNSHKLALSYEELTNLSDSAIAERALTLHTEISRSTNKELHKSPGDKAQAAQASPGKRERIQKTIQSGDRADLVKEIEMMTAESKLAASSSKPSQVRAEVGIRLASPVPSDEELSSGLAGMDLGETLRYDALIGSRFLEGGTGGGVWSYVDSWYILGPIEKNQAQFSEDRIEFNLGKRYPQNQTNSSSWEYTVSDSPAIALSKSKKQQTYFLYSELYAEETQEIVFWLRGTDNARLWVNHNPEPSIVSYEKDLGESFCVATLNSGYNSLELRVDSSGSHGYLWLVHSNQVAKALGEL